MMRCDCCANDASLQDNLAADVRVETERRLKALEAELAQAELANRERTMATRYHKVKFFGVYSIISWSIILLTRTRTSKSNTKD